MALTIPDFDANPEEWTKGAIDEWATKNGFPLDQRMTRANMIADLVKRVEAATKSAPAPVFDKFIEVRLVRKYAPVGFMDDDGVYEAQIRDIKRSLPAGEVLKLPAAEAKRALDLGIAVITENTFG